MKEIRWNLTKNKRLKKIRGVSFEEVIQGKLVKVKDHPQRKHQNVMLFLHQNYIWAVPYVESENEIFLKTLYQSRKYTKWFKKGVFDETN